MDGCAHKMEIDYSSAVDELLPKVMSMAESGELDCALEQVLSLEKQTRSASDIISTGRLLVILVQLLAENSRWKQLNEHLILMTKKHGQMKQAVTKMVQKAIEFLEKTPEESVKLELIDSLRNVTEGKIYVETERARLTKQLADIKESHGDIETAASLLQDLQVETFGSMEKQEKVHFMLEQMRLCLAKGDYIRTQIISRKISTKFFNDEKQEELKLKYYDLMIELDAHSSSYLSISKHYWEIYNTKSVQEDEVKRLMALRHVITYLMLAPYDNERSDLMFRRKELKDLEKLPVYQEMLMHFTTKEIVRWDDFCSKYETILRTQTGVFSRDTVGATADKRWSDLNSRVNEHNISVIAAYYTTIRLSRMAHLLELDPENAEEYLSNLVVNKTVYAKIDRLGGVVSFVRKKSSTEILNDWSYNTNNIMKLIGRIIHLITKDRVIHGV